MFPNYVDKNLIECNGGVGREKSEQSTSNTFPSFCRPRRTSVGHIAEQRLITWVLRVRFDGKGWREMVDFCANEQSPQELEQVRRALIPSSSCPICAKRAFTCTCSYEIRPDMGVGSMGWMYGRRESCSDFDRSFYAFRCINRLLVVCFR